MFASPFRFCAAKLVASIWSGLVSEGEQWRTWRGVCGVSGVFVSLLSPRKRLFFFSLVLGQYPRPKYPTRSKSNRIQPFKRVDERVTSFSSTHDTFLSWLRGF